MTEQKLEENKGKSELENEEENFILLYSPRTEYSMKLEEEEKMYNELKLNFDPITIKIIKKHFKERLGALKKEEMVAILKNHLLGFLPNHPNREKIMVKLLLRLFSDIDLNDNGDLEWNEFTNYIVHLGSDNNKAKNKDYRLKYYAKSLYTINASDLTEKITYAFCLEKNNVIGIVQEGKSNILFYETKKCKKLKCYIDLKDIQTQVDTLEFLELNNRANKLLEKELEEKREKKKHLNSKNNNNKNPNLQNDSLNKENSPKDQKKKKKIEDKKINQNSQNQINQNDILNLSKTKLIKSSLNKKLSILCACFIPEYDLILISGTNNTITAWKYIKEEVKNVNVTQDFRLSKEELRIAILIAESPQYAMCWDPALKLLFTGQKDGKILKWDLTKPNPIIEDTLDIKTVKKKLSNNPNYDKENNNKEDNKKIFEELKKKSFKKFNDNNINILDEKEKNMSVSCLLLLQKLQLLAASYYNGNIILWDTLLKDYRKFYTDQSTGIYSMAFDSIRNLIFTCGFSHDIFVYDPYIDGSYVYKLIGHNWSINSIECNEKESELISVDILGTIKVWDTSLLINFQTIKINEQFVDNSKKNHAIENKKNKKLSSNMKMLYINKLKKIFVYGNKLLFFETDRANNPELADDQVICSCYYDKTSKTLLSFCLRKIKLWNILTGKVKQIYDDPMGGEVTSIVVDRNVKRGFLGDNTGKIRNINLKTGQIIKDLTSHSTEIKFLCHSMSLNIVCSCSIDNIIKIHNDSELLETEVIKELSIFQFQVRALCIVDRFSRLGIGLSNGVVKFYDIEHFHYDSDLQSDPSLIKDEVSALSAIENVELVLCCYSSGICKFIVTPPSAVKFSSILEFNNCENQMPIAVSCIEFDKVNHWVFIGDLLGNIKCYDMSELYKVIDNIIENEQRNFDNETIITKENYDLFTGVKIINLWSIEAHKESIRHIHYVDLYPRIIITTSHDLRIKIFEAETGKFQDEFKQISNRFKPIPIGIKFYLLDPFSDDNKIKSEPMFFYRKDIEKFNPMVNQENSNQQISEYSKKITEFNAKEKLWVNCKNSNLPSYQISNNWNLKIDVKKVLENEEIEYQKTFKIVKEVEKITNETELILQEKSIYSDSYKPKYIEEMTDLEQIKEFSNVIAERLRNVKLAVSKANLNQSKMVDLSNKKKNKRNFIKSKSALNIKNDHNNFNNDKNINNLKKNLALPKIKSKYNFNQTKIHTPADLFNKLHDDFKNGYSQIFLPFRLLIKKSKRQSRILIKSKSQNAIEENEKKTDENELRLKRLNSLEGNLKHLEHME